MNPDVETVTAVMADAAAATAEAEAPPSVFGKVDCAAFTFGTEEDAAVFAAAEDAFNNFQADPSVDAFSAVQHQLVSLAGYPLVTAVLSGRYPRLFSSLKAQQEALGVDAVAPAHVAGVDWDLWCRNTWLTNSCAVDDLGEVAQTILPALASLLRQVERDNDNHVNEVWSELHVLAWALRSSPAARALVAPLTQCKALWELVSAELVRGGRHTSLQLVLLDLLGALALHASASTELLTQLCTIAGARAQFPHPLHFHTAMKLCYACVVCGDAAQTSTQTTLEHLRRAWTAMKGQTSAIPAPLHAAEWIVGEDAQSHLAIAEQLHRQLATKEAERLDVEAVKLLHTTVSQLPSEARAFCLYALPGNALLCLHAALQNTAAAEDLVTEVVAMLVEDVVVMPPPTEEGGRTDVSKADGYVQYCIQQLWMDGLSATLLTLLQRRTPTITAAVMRLLHHLAACSRQGSAARRVLLGSPSLSLVGDVLSGVAESADVKTEMEKAVVAEVVEEALHLIRALTTSELTSVFTDSLVFTVSTVVSEGKENAALLRLGLRALAHLAVAFPMAGSLVLDFEFLMEKCAVPDAPTDASAALVVGSLEMMSAIVAQQPAAVTFEWIEMLLSVIKNLDGWRGSVPGLDTALWRCVRHTVEASEDCNEYLFTEEAQEALRNELERMKYHDAGFCDVLPSLLGIAVCLQALEHAEVNAALAEVLRGVPATAWTPEMCTAALRFVAAAYGANGEEAELVASPPSSEEAHKSDGGQLGQTIAGLAVCVMVGAHQSEVALSSTSLEAFAASLEKKGVAADVMTALFDMADSVESALRTEDKETSQEDGASLSHAILPLLHCVVSHCPSARTEATADRAAHLFTRIAVDGESAAAKLCSPEAIDAALLLVNDTCAVNFDDADDEAKRTRVMQNLWPGLSCITRRASDAAADAGWQRVLSRVFGAAHALLLGSTTVPFSPDGDPRLDYIGECGLPNVARESCNTLVQTVLHYDEARAYLRNKYASAYRTSLAFMADPAHNSSGVVPLSLLRYVEETEKP